MPNPGNPSEQVETLENGSSDAIGADDLLNIFAALLRGLCLLGAFLLFCVGAYFGLVVFSHLRLTIMDPESAKTSVDTIAELIDAPKLSISPPNGETIQFGRLVSFVLLLACYVIWLCVPMGIMSTAGRILLRGFDRRDPR